MSSDQVQKLWDEYNKIVGKVNRRDVSHPVPYLCYEFANLLERITKQGEIVFIHAKYCKEHDPDVKELKRQMEDLKRRGENLAQSIRDLNANKNYPYDFENLSQALSIWEKTQ